MDKIKAFVVDNKWKLIAAAAVLGAVLFMGFFGGLGLGCMCK